MFSTFVNLNKFELCFLVPEMYLVYPILEYGSSVWDSHCAGLSDALEKKSRACNQVCD